jgi:S1-C subfamily serine protease
MATPAPDKFLHVWLSVVLFALGLMVVFPTGPAMSFTEEETNTIDVYERVAPSIVNITTEACEPDFMMCVIPEKGSGSGIILSEDGIIVTNHHVIAQAKQIQVSLDDGRQFNARVIGSAPQHDVALLQIDSGEARLRPLPLGDSNSVQVGEKVLAVGNPFGLGQTLTVGTVSMTGRDIQNGDRILRGLIQTDAAINPGNSGGALVSSRGLLIGMNTVILSPTGSSIGIGFAIPVNVIKKVTPGIIHRWGKWLGWTMAILILVWLIRRIYSPRLKGYGRP